MKNPLDNTYHFGPGTPNRYCFYVLMVTFALVVAAVAWGILS